MLGNDLLSKGVGIIELLKMFGDDMHLTLIFFSLMISDILLLGRGKLDGAIDFLVNLL